MADILIRGMDIPKDGRKHTALLQFLEDGKCRGIVEYSKSYDDRSVKVFEVVPLPEGHGDLIDRDALKKRTPMVIDYSAGGFGTDGSIRPVRGYGDWQIDQAPTIVPAEGSVNDGN